MSMLRTLSVLAVPSHAAPAIVSGDHRAVRGGYL